MHSTRDALQVRPGGGGLDGGGLPSQGLVGSGAASSSSVPPSGSVSKEQLRQKLKYLKELLNDELIDEDDYKQQKTELMTFFQAAQ